MTDFFHQAIEASVPSPSFNPTTPSGLLWMVHPNDATDIILNGTTGDLEINSILDRVAGHNFVANAAANRMPLNTTERPGHQVADAKTSNADWLRCSDAVLAQSLVGGAFTLFSFHRHDSTSAGSLQNIMQHNAGTTHGGGTFTNRVRLTYNAGSPGNLTLYISDAGHSTFAWDAADGFTADHVTNWTSWIITYDGAGTAECWANGISLGIDTDVHRVPTLTNVHYGGGASGSNFIHFGPQGAYTSALSADHIRSLHSWILNNA